MSGTASPCVRMNSIRQDDMQKLVKSARNFSAGKNPVRSEFDERNTQTYTAAGWDVTAQVTAQSWRLRYAPPM